MSTKLGTLTLDLIAKVGSFTGPIRDAERQTQSSFSNMRKHVNTYGLAVAGAAAGAVTALAAMALETANQAAELEIFAFRANTTTQEFQKMAVGAKAFGVEGDKLSDMMKDFNEKLGELTAIGAGGGVDFFEKIAMKTEGSSEAAKKLILDMQKLSGPEALQMYVNKLEEAGVTQQQMSFYLESMASDLTDLYPLLANGGEGLRLYGDMAERAGIIMTDKTIESAKALKDQVYMLDLQLQGAKNQLMQAVIPAFVDIAEAFFGGSDQGLQFTEVANGVAKGLKGVAAVAIGAVTAIQLVGKALGGMAAIGGAILSNKDWYEMGPLGYAKAAYDARDEISALTSEIKTDMHETIMGAAGRLDKMWAGGSSEKAKQLRGIRELNQTVGQTNGGLSELANKQNKVDRATSGANKALQEQNRLLEQQKRDREQISKTYASDFQNRVWDEKEQQDLVKNSGFSASEQTKYLALVQKRFDAENAEYFKTLNLEFNQYKWLEEKKLEYTYQMDREIAENDVKIADEVREAKLKFLDEQYAYQKKELEISQAKELLQTKRNWMTAGEYAQQYYALVREEILNTPSYSPEMKDALIQQANSQQNIEVSGESDQAIADYRDVMGYEESPLIKQYEVLDKMRKLDLINEEKYQQDKLQLQALSTAGYMEGMLGGFASLVDENSKTYAVLFAAQKAFAVAQAMLNIPAAYSKAYDAVVGTPYIGPYIAPAVGAAAAALQVAQAASIKGVGYADGGFTGSGGKYEPAGIVHKGEGVLTQEEIAALGGPSGFYALRQSIKNGFADGGLVDAPKVLNPNQNKDINNYLSQAQSNSNSQQSTPQNLQINNILDPSIVGDFMGTSSGTKTFMNFIKNNRSSIKAMIA